MSIVSFVALFLSVYGALHLYVLVKVRRAWYVEGAGYFLFFLVLVVLMTAPIQARWLQGQGHTVAALIMTWVAYLWMGLLFLFICLTVPLDIYHLLLSAIQNVMDADLTPLMLSRRQSLNVALVVAMGIMLYGMFEARRIQTEHVVLHSPKIPQINQPVRMVQISDLHLGLMLYPGRLSNIIAAIEAARPDILVSTGDLVDSQFPGAETAARLLTAVQAPLGKFAVTGNHEFYAGIERAIHFTRQAGFQVLQGEAVDSGGILTIAGVDDPAGGRTAFTNETQLLTGLPANRFTVLLKHRPTVDAAAQAYADLQLSGHTHKGQVFPFTWMLKMRYRWVDGLHRVSETGHLYISRGTGTWGPPIRFLAKPEITVIELRSTGNPAPPRQPAVKPAR